MITHLNVNETFGPTIQGEGRMAGHLCGFLRLANCNLTCSWCDTPYTWDWSRFNREEEVKRMRIEEVAALLDPVPGRIVVSGGEPLLQAAGLSVLSGLLPGRVFDLETNGTRPLGLSDGMWDTITCSPKIIPSAGQREIAFQIHADHLARSDFKFVISDKADLAAATSWVAVNGVDHSRVWLMPEGTDHRTLTSRTPWLMETAARLGFNFTTRLHVYGWGDERGH